MKKLLQTCYNGLKMKAKQRIMTKSSKNTETIHWRSNLNLRGRQRSCDIINIDDIPGSVGGLARNKRLLKMLLICYLMMKCLHQWLHKQT